jgi:transposase
MHIYRELMVKRAGITLSDTQQKELMEFRQATSDKLEYRAATGVLLRSEGRSAKDVASELGVKQRAVFDWCKNYAESGPEGLHMNKPTGRPAHRGERAKELIPNLLEQDPQSFGFLKGRWVVRDIAKALGDEGITLSFQHVQHILRELGVKLKSPKLRAPGSISKNHKKRAEVRKYKRIAPALLKRGSRSRSRTRSG